MGLNSVAYQRIKEMILNGEIPMGTRLLETRLAPTLQMSRTPIREALQQLHVEGMLEEDEAGLFTKTYTREQILEVYHCRAILESEAVKLIAETGLPLDAAQVIEDVLTTCDDMLRGMTHLDREQAARIKQDFLVQNNIYHDALYNSCPNHSLLAMLRRTERLPEAIRNYSSFTPEQLIESHLGHKQIVRAIQFRDAERAAALMREHIWASRDRMNPALHQSLRLAIPTTLTDVEKNKATVAHT